MELPEIIYSTSNKEESRQLSKLLKEEKIRKILPKAYTSNFYESDEEIIRKHIFNLIAKHYPNSLISHRTAVEYRISDAGNVYLTGTQNRVVKWTGVTLKFTKGSQRLESDPMMYNGVYVSSVERALLENLTSSRKTDDELKTVDEKVIEEKLLVRLNSEGEDGLNVLRDKARVLSEELGMQKEFEKLNTKIGALLTTKPSKMLTSPLAMAQAQGEPYDPYRVQLFEQLVGDLRYMSFTSRKENATNSEEFRRFAFYDGYFSNYIEGTTFTLEEAEQIVYENAVIPNRLGDTHDISGTYKICSDRFEMNKNAKTPDEHIELMRDRHQVVLGGRSDKSPGMFKTLANRAGNTHFVSPNQVKGTLKIGYELLESLESPLSRAIYLMFMISEVHPFNDGNGRIARIMMNGELVKQNEQRILIPTVYRDDYLGALRQFTRQKTSRAYIKMLDRIHDYSKWLDPSSDEKIKNQLEYSNAFSDAELGTLRWDSSNNIIK